MNLEQTRLEARRMGPLEILQDDPLIVHPNVLKHLINLGLLVNRVTTQIECPRCRSFGKRAILVASTSENNFFIASDVLQPSAALDKWEEP